MYDELVERLRADADYMDNNGIMLYAAAPFYRECADAIEELTGFVQEAERDRDEYRERLDKANDAIEERDRYALTIQHEMMGEAESHIALVERLNKQIGELQKQVAYWQAQLTKSMCGETLAELERPRWIPVSEGLPEEGQYVLVSYMSISGTMMAVSYWFLDDRNKVRWGGENELFVTHWMPFPPAPEPPKEEE